MGGFFGKSDRDTLVEVMRGEIAFLRQQIRDLQDAHGKWMEARQQEIIALADRRATYDVINARHPPPIPGSPVVADTGDERAVPWQQALMGDGHLDPTLTDEERAAQLRGEYPDDREDATLRG
jgi:hypothetical protein